MSQKKKSHNEAQRQQRAAMRHNDHKNPQQARMTDNRPQRVRMS